MTRPVHPPTGRPAQIAPHEHSARGAAAHSISPAAVGADAPLDGAAVPLAAGAERPDAPRVHDRRSRRKPGRNGAAWLIAAALLAVIFDQASKAWIRGTLLPGAELEVWPGWVHLSHVLNRGAAWGMLEGQRWLLVVVTLGVLAGTGMMARSVMQRGPVAATGLGLIVGGAVGNLIDRVLLGGAVTDMIDLDTPIGWLQSFPVFNIADCALTLGVGLLLWIMLLNSEHSEERPERERLEEEHEERADKQLDERRLPAESSS